MLRFRWLVWAGVATAVGPGAATAGPINWEYRADFTVARLYDGGEYILTGSQIDQELFSRLVASDPGTRWGWATVPIGRLLPEGGTGPNMPLPPNTYSLSVTLRDVASGQEGSLLFTGSGWETIVTDWPDYHRLLSRRVTAQIRSPTGTQDLVLGGNDYHVTLLAEAASDGSGSIDALVTVGTVNQTPEPATIVLAGAGLVGFGLGRLKRRMRP